MSQIGTLKTQKQNMDPVIYILLDQVLEMTGIDPTSVLPEFRLGKDLNLSKVKALKLVNDTLHVLNKTEGTELVNTDRTQDFSKFSLKEVTAWVKSLRNEKQVPSSFKNAA